MPRGLTVAKGRMIKEVALRLGIKPNELMAVISYETGGSFSSNRVMTEGASCRLNTIHDRHCS